MATYESFLKINGTVGDLVFYNLNGKNIVRKKSGFNKNAFRKSASYEKVRQNSSEFGHCSKTGKIIRQSLEYYIKKSGDALLYQKFARLMTEIKDLDVLSVKGKRTVKNGLATESGLKLLQSFRFGKFENSEAKVFISEGLWDYSLTLEKGIAVDQIILETLKIDFENYHSQNYTEIISIEKPLTEYVFQKYFSEDADKLFFVVLKKDEKIIQMGFV